MRTRIATLCAILWLAATLSAQNPPTGTWEGESKCTVPNSPCHDEHVIYEITALSSGTLNIKMDKVVNGQREEMGSLECKYDDKARHLTCPMDGRKPGVWEFKVAGDTMSGTATLREGNLLYRRITVVKQRTR